jgi:hypothetical protein
MVSCEKCKADVESREWCDIHIRYECEDCRLKEEKEREWLEFWLKSCELVETMAGI